MTRRSRLTQVSLLFALSVGACAAPPPPPPSPTLPPVARQERRPKPAPDWFHRQLAAAHHARITHVPPGDKAGAQRAYDAIMVPACGKIAASGPAKYRAQCRTMVQRANDAAAALAESPTCRDDSDDAPETAAQVTACSD